VRDASDNCLSALLHRDAFHADGLQHAGVIIHLRAVIAELEWLSLDRKDNERLARAREILAYAALGFSWRSRAQVFTAVMMQMASATASSSFLWQLKSQMQMLRPSASMTSPMS
jgi:hypothetical protein